MTASIFDSKYKGGDNNWHNTRYNRSYAQCPVWQGVLFKDNSRSLGLNMRANFTGESAIRCFWGGEYAVRRIITDEVNAFSKQFDRSCTLMRQ